MRFFLSAVFLTLLSASVFEQTARAMEIGLGLSAIEEGDDRIRPGVLTHVGWHKNFYSRFFYYGRKFGPVTERTYVLSTNYKLDIFRFFGTNYAFGSVGLVLMNQQTEIKFPGDSENSETENDPNLGFQFGAVGDIPIPGPIFLQISLESHMFLAGEAGILLANGRKQMLSLVSGVRF